MFLKCKICGGDIELNDEKGIGTCLYCGSVMTFPKATDEQKVSMFNRGNHFRLAGEFDEALVIYEQIIQEDDKDAEAHWCAALSRFGIEYVEDPSTMEYLPTCHRASFDSFLDDIDVKSAIDNSDGITKRQYQKDALKIEEVRQGILATSSKEDPFDVFICYKETDQNGGRTQDSVLAQDIYDRLTEKGYKVFFSRITLEDRVGTEYEPYIFAALNSAKAMIVVGTSKENLDAVWVKNEWSRFLAMMRKDRNKAIIPCYKDMDPYDMPEALSVLQSYNMGAIGFTQDLIRGVGKVVGLNNDERKVVGNNPGFPSKNLVERIYILLEDGSFSEAKEYCDKLLDQEPRNSEAYLGKFMVEYQIRKKENITDLSVDLTKNKLFQRALEFADENDKKELLGFIERVSDKRKEIQKRKNKRIKITGIVIAVLSILAVSAYFIYVHAIIPEEKYKSGLALMSEQKYEEAIVVFNELQEYKESNNKIEECKQRITDIKEAEVVGAFEADISNIENAEMGSSIIIGSYEMDGNSDNGKESMEWVKIGNNDGKVLLISKYGIEQMKFDKDISNQWDVSSIRKWLNEDFIEDAFKDYEKQHIVYSDIPAMDNPWFIYCDPGDDTEDRVFLLSYQEADAFLNDVDENLKKCQLYKDDSVDNQGVRYCKWWLRSPGNAYHYIGFVDPYGRSNYEGAWASSEDVYIRPAMWVTP